MPNRALKASLSTVALLSLTATAQAAGTFPVTNGNDAGDGSLRAALAAAASAGGGTVVIGTGNAITIASPLDYDGTGPVTIMGAGNTVATDGNFTVLAASQGADLTVLNLILQGPGGFDIENRGDTGGDAGKGIFVDIRDDQTGIARLVLQDVTVRDVAGHGVHVSDCNLADDCGGGGGGAGEGSDASILVALDDVTIANAGNGRFDADGLRVDERGPGHITVNATGSTFIGVGADGVELDEGQDGHVTATFASVSFIDNGGYCDPDLLEAFLPVPDEAEFAEGEMAEDAIPGPVTGSPDDRCIEREVDTYDDGSVEAYEFGIDVDDGFDIDEAGDGTVFVSVTNGTVLGNLDEGLDFDEEDAGGISFGFYGSTAQGNADDGVKLTEEGDGGITGQVSGGVSVGNGGKGFVFEAEDDGDLDVTVVATVTAGNDDSDDTGIEAVREGDGEGTLTVIGSDIADGIDAEGADVAER